MTGPLHIKLDEMKINFGLNRTRLIDHRFYRDNRRTFLAF